MKLLKEFRDDGLDSGFQKAIDQITLFYILLKIFEKLFNKNETEYENLHKH